MPQDLPVSPEPDADDDADADVPATRGDRPPGGDPKPEREVTAGPTLRLLVVPGVNPAKWLRVWQERLPDVPAVLVHADAAEGVAALLAGDADAGLVRLPVDDDRLHAIPLYTETTVVVVPADHLLTAVDELSPDELAGEVLLVPDDDVVGWDDHPGEPSAMPAPATTAQAVELVAAGVGLLVVPQSLARLHHRRDLTFRPVTDAPGSTVALAWPAGTESDLVEELIGIVRGRTVNSSRGRAAPAATPEPAPDRSRRPGAGGSTGGAGTRGAGGGRAGGRSAGGRSGAGGSGGGRPGGGRGKGAPGRGKGTGRAR
jgi:hypothetical protein